jgi:phosphoesterase RecJ-like protein
MYDNFKQLVEPATHILVIQAENPDGDSLGSALALEEILSDLGKKVTLYCPVDMPKYLRYARGWDRVEYKMPKDFDLTVIVDTASKTLLEKALKPENMAQLKNKPIAVLDHHVTEGDLPFEVTTISDTTSVATGELIYKIATDLNWPINAQAAENLIIAILSDSLGMTTEATTAHSIHTVGSLVELGANVSEIDGRRREFNKKSREILAYKATLISRIEYHVDGQLALVHIPWEEIEKYSDQYNPSMLVMDEMRLVEGVRVAVALKTYPDGKITGKLRNNADAKVADTIAGYFGGGGHPYAAGFRVYEDYDKVRHELIGAVDKILKEHDNAKVS